MLENHLLAWQPGSLHDLDGAAGRADCWPDPCPLPASCPDQSFFSNLPYGLAAVL